MTFDDLLTVGSLLLIVYAVLLKVGAFRALDLPAVVGAVKRLIVAIPWTPPQAAQRQQRIQIAPVTIDRHYVAQRHREAMRRISAARAGKLAAAAGSDLGEVGKLTKSRQRILEEMLIDGKPVTAARLAVLMPGRDANALQAINEHVDQVRKLRQYHPRARSLRVEEAA